MLAATVRGAKSPNVPLNSDSNRRTKEIRRWPEDAALIITSPDFHPSRVGRRTMTTKRDRSWRRQSQVRNRPRAMFSIGLSSTKKAHGRSSQPADLTKVKVSRQTSNTDLVLDPFFNKSCSSCSPGKTAAMRSRSPSLSGPGSKPWSPSSRAGPPSRPILIASRPS